MSIIKTEFYEKINHIRYTLFATFFLFITFTSEIILIIIYKHFSKAKLKKKQYIFVL